MEELLRIGQLFASLHWPTDDTRDSPFPYLFTRFCRMWARLAPSERGLILAITPSYTWIRNKEIEQRFFRAWEKTIANLPPGTQSVALVNLPKSGPKGPKSHDVMFYVAKGCESMLRLSGIRVSLHSSYAKYNGTHTTTFAFLDDYVGTGNSVSKALTLLRRKNPAANWNAIFVIALAAQAEAVTALKALDCTLVADTILDRGIRDSTLQDKNEAYRIMNNIGIRLEIGRSDRLGYGNSEGLVTMTRTPNNTFPVYWTTKKVRGRLWNAPFPRYTERTSPDWDIENSWNFPLPAVNGNRQKTIELHKVLECVRDRRDPQVLEKYQIPFSRSLHYLESMLERGTVGFQGEVLHLTPHGHSMLSEAAGGHWWTVPSETAAQDAEPPTEEQKSLYVPKEVVE